MSNNKLNILAFAGSLRKGSYNRALLRAASALAPGDMNIDIFDLEGLPLYNADVEAEGDPEYVALFKESIGSADALLIATPEYNYGIPGVLKNAIDWASRPANGSPLKNKPAGILGASPSLTGSVLGQNQLRECLVSTGSFCMPQPRILVFRAHEKFDEQGNLTDKSTGEHLGRFLEEFAGWVRYFIK